MAKIGVLLYVLVYIFTEVMFLVFDFFGIIENWELRG